VLGKVLVAAVAEVAYEASLPSAGDGRARVTSIVHARD
jgi:hypothetical protein